MGMDHTSPYSSIVYFYYNSVGQWRGKQWSEKQWKHKSKRRAKTRKAETATACVGN